MLTMRTIILATILAAVSLARPLQDAVEGANVTPALPRLIIYFQTMHDSTGRPISMLPLITEKEIALTHLIVCSFHVNSGSTIHLNDNPPDDPIFDTLWAESNVLRDAGVKVMGMIGGAAPGSFNSQTLDSTDEATFNRYYGQVRQLVNTYGLQGLDLDVEQPMSQRGVERLISRLRSDFGDDFVVTLAPVASALRGGSNLSGFDYKDLEEHVGDRIGFYNAQFYNGFGSMTNTAAFDAVVSDGWDPRKVVVGQLTAPESGGQYVPIDKLNSTIVSLRESYGEIGGIMGWEYFNSAPGGRSAPWVWAQEMTDILRPNGRFKLSITKEIAENLEVAWRNSVITDAEHKLSSQVAPNINYTAMINA